MDREAGHREADRCQVRNPFESLLRDECAQGFALLGHLRKMNIKASAGQQRSELKHPEACAVDFRPTVDAGFTFHPLSFPRKFSRNA